MMKKKRFTFFIVTLLCALLTLCSCGVYNPATGGWGGNNGGGNDPTGSNPEIDYSDEDMFSVTLTMNGKEYVPGTEIEAIWKSANSLHKATVGDNGIAIADGLDGDYTVMLSAVPDGYAYDPNLYVADNYNRHVTIDLRSIAQVRDPNRGTTPETAHMVNKTGVYKIELSSANDIEYFCYEPTATGKYSIESWVDITESKINPRLDYWYGNIQAGLRPGESYDDEGASGPYTKNFKFEIDIPNGSVGQSFTVGLKADSRTGEYPVTYLFAIKLNGEFPSEEKDNDLVIAKWDFKAHANYNHEYLDSQYTFVGAEKTENGANVFDEDMYELHEQEGWFRLKRAGDEAGKPTGPILYAKISQPCRFYDLSLNSIEYVGNKALTINGVNYKFFVEGKGSFGRKGYFCVWHEQNKAYCPCLLNNRCAGACLVGCTKCHEQCRNVSQAVLDSQGGYADYCNSDGVYPVTQELKDFLQAFSISQSLFFDGNGHVETHALKVYAGEADQWLFACGYYKAI